MVESNSQLLTVVEEARKTKPGADKDGACALTYTARHLWSLRDIYDSRHLWRRPEQRETPSSAHSRNTEPLAWIREFPLGARPLGPEHVSPDDWAGLHDDPPPSNLVTEDSEPLLTGNSWTLEVQDSLVTRLRI